MTFDSSGIELFVKLFQILAEVEKNKSIDV